MKRALWFLVWTFLLIAPAHAQDAACISGSTRVPKAADVIVVANVSPCGWLLKFKATDARQDFRIRGTDGSPDVKVFPPGTTCRWWYDWGGVWTIAVDDVNCTVYVNTIEGAAFAAKVRRLE